MTAILMRSALIFHGHSVPADLHSVVIDATGSRRAVTWSDVMQRRRERQEWLLRQKRIVRQARAYKVWVAYFDQFLMGGWQAFIENGGERVWIDRDRRWLIEPLMRQFPLLLPGCDDWHRWKIEFARQLRRGEHDGRPRGVAFVWWDGRDDLRRAA